MAFFLLAFADWLAQLVETLGYPGLALAVLCETLFPPLPSEALLPVAGFLAGQGTFSFFPLVLAATSGSLGGALVLYGLGRALGEPRLRALVRRHGRALLLSEAHLDQAQSWFVRHGPLAVLVGRLLPVARTFISVPAGLTGMGLGRFCGYTAAGSALWNGVLIGTGFVLAEQWALIGPHVGWLQYLFVPFFLVGLAWWATRRAGRLAPTAP